MEDSHHKTIWFDRLLTAKVALAFAISLLLVISGVATGVAIWHGKELCQRFTEQNSEHRAYMEGEARAIATKVSTSMDALTAQSKTLAELVQAMRAEQSAREERIISAADAIYAEAREFRKAALTLYRKIEEQQP